MAETSYPNNAYYNDPYDFNTKWSLLNVQDSFQFDNQPTNIIMVGDRDRGGTGGRDTNGYYNDLYQISFRLQRKELNGYQSWMNWIEKIQPDYKFLTVDQKNTQTVVYQNVDDPWMFTQYIYKGTGKVYNPYFDLQGSQDTSITDSSYLVIQPALYNPQTLQPLNYAAKCLDKQLNDEQIPTDKPVPYKRVNSKGWYELQYGGYQYKRYTTGADGCLLYRGQICIESIKWGQHGNIPPHVINMMAPKQYVESATKLVLKPTTKTVYGIPVYVDEFGYGTIGFNNGKYYVTDEIGTYHDQVRDEQTEQITDLGYFQYVEPDISSRSTEILQTTIRNNNPKISVRRIATQIKKGDVIYNGCKYFGLIAQDKVGCTLQKNMTNEQKQYAFCDGTCYQNGSKNTICRYFVQRGQTVAYRYEAVPQNYYANNSAQITNLVNMGMTQMAFGGAAGIGTGLQAIGQALNAKANTTFKNTVGLSASKQTTYEYVQQPLNAIQVYIPPNSQNNKGAVIKRGTGQTALEQPGLKVRKIYDNDTSQINYHRWLSKILPCYNRQFCNDTVGPDYYKKIKNGTNCGVNYLDYGDNNQIVTKTNDFCPYYNKAHKGNLGCPYNTVNKTGMDFIKVNSALYQSYYVNYGISIITYILRQIENNNKNQANQPIQYSGQFLYSTITLNELNDEGSGDLAFNVYYRSKIFYENNNYKNVFSSQNVALIQLNNLFGLQQQVLKQHKRVVESTPSQQNQNEEQVAIGDGDYFICTTYVKVDKYHIKNKKNKYGELQNYVDVFFYYNAYTTGQYSNGNISKPTKIATWFTKMVNCAIPDRDPTVIDNQIKFMGGYHPQYLETSCPPQEILYTKQVPFDQQLSTVSKSDQNEYGDKALGSQKQVKFGHFIEQNGNWLIQETSIGTPIVYKEEISDEPNPDNGDLPIEQNNEDEYGDIQTTDVQESVQYRAQNPTASYQGGLGIRNRWQNSKIDPQGEENQQKQIINCLVYTNDTKSSIEWLRKNPPKIQQTDSKGNQKQRKVPVQISQPQALPLQRQFAYCETCDTVLPLRFLRYNYKKQNNKCPWCGHKLVRLGKMQAHKTPRTKAIGRVVIWGLPGTIIKTDTYFWKAATMVNNALISQMQFKLGVKNVNGGGYGKSDNTSETQAIDRIQFTTKVGKYYKDMSYDLWLKTIAKTEPNSSNSSQLLQSYNSYNIPNTMMVNPTISQDVLPSAWSATTTTNNKLITPFTNDNGLKMISNDYMVAFRNRLQPTLAYYIGASNVNTGANNIASGDVLSQDSRAPNHPGEYQMYRTSYDDRKQLSNIKYWVKKRITCKPIVLAYCCGNGQSQTICKVTYPSGDNDVGNLVKYYPQDPKWWFNKQWIGGIHTKLVGNPYHFDYDGWFQGGLYSAYAGMKKQVSSQCYIIPAGFVPLDKQVVAAYLYYNAEQNDAYEPAIGQLQLPSGRKITIYLHYHPFFMGGDHQLLEKAGGHMHEMTDNLVYDEITNEQQLKQFKRQHRIFDKDLSNMPEDFSDWGVHTQEGRGSYYDKYGDKFYIDTKSGLPISARMWHNKHDKDEVKTQDIHEFKWMQQNLKYTPLVAQADMKYHASGINFTHEKNNFGKSDLPDCISWNGFGTDIIRKKSENAIWKNYTKQYFEFLQQQFLSTVQLQIDTGDGNPTTYSFDQYYWEFANFIQGQMQPIPNYFNLSGINSAGYIRKYQKTSQSDTIQGTYQELIITQAGGDPSNNGDVQDAGEGSKVFDITKQFKKIYGLDKRLDRYYIGMMGQKNIKQALAYNYNSTNASKFNPSSNEIKQDSESKTWSTNYNNRLKEKNPFFVLNTNYWYPVLGQENVFSHSNDGTKIQLNTSVLYFYGLTKSNYYISDDLQITCTIGQKTSTMFFSESSMTSFSSGTVIDTNTLVSCMNKVASTVGKSTIINSSGNITFYPQKIKNTENKQYYPTMTFTFNGLLQSPQSVKSYNQFGNRVLSYTDYCGQYHPYGLLRSASFIKNDNNAWITRRQKQQIQQVVFDLIQPPLQTQRRDYLADRGSVTYEQSKCENENCDAYGILNGIYAKKNGKQPSENCSSCGKPLEPVKKGCDNIKSWWYTQNLQDDVIIAGIKIKPTSLATNSTTRKLAPISLFISSDNKNWECILSLHPTTDNTSYTYSTIYTSSSAYSIANTSISFKANELTDIKFIGDFSTTGNETSEEGDVFSGVLNRGRYLKLVTLPQPYTNRKTFGTNQFIYTSQYQYVQIINFDGDMSNNPYMMRWGDGAFKGAKLVFEATRQEPNQEPENISIVRFAKDFADCKEITGRSRFYIEPINTEHITINSISLSYVEYFSCVDSLIVYGGGYIPSQVVVTPKPTILSGSYNYQIRIGYLPIKFYKVSAIISGALQYPLQQIKKYDDIDDPDKGIFFTLETVTQTISVVERDDDGNAIYNDGKISYVEKNIKYYKIKSGRFYFDIVKKRIMMPRYGRATQYIQQKSFGTTGASRQEIQTLPSLNEQEEQYTYKYQISLKDLGKNLSKWGCYRNLIPNEYFVSMWSGNESGVQVRVTAQNNGPSYQVQKGAICQIDYSNTNLSSPICMSTPLANPNGSYTSFDDMIQQTAERPVSWIAYNKQLATVPQKSSVYMTNKGYFYKDILGTQLYQNNKAYWDRQIVGNELQKFVGKCQADITLKGSPNTFLRGKLRMKAPKQKIRWIGTTAHQERTGGMSTGILIRPTIKSQSNRATMAYSRPYILAYLKQRKSEDNFQS